jgi:hypothetical protein
VLVFWLLTIKVRVTPKSPPLPQIPTTSTHHFLQLAKVGITLAFPYNGIPTYRTRAMLLATSNNTLISVIG